MLHDRREWFTGYTRVARAEPEWSTVKTKATSVVSGKARDRVTYLYDGVERRSPIELG